MQTLIDINKVEDLSVLANELLTEQKKSFPLAKTGYDCLNTIKVKEFNFDNFQIRVQFNPGRITSSSAKVDEKSIRERKCFLCGNNLPVEQKGINIFEKYSLLVNPFPIFSEHFTIPDIEHRLQLIKDSFIDMLLLTKALGRRYTLFYNGPKCGASAPDHFHFQAGLKNFMPIDYEYDNIVYSNGNLFYRNKYSEIYRINNYLRNFISVESSNLDDLQNIWSAIYDSLPVKENEPEPMMNIITSFVNGKWRVNIFPRKVHRPKQFFLEGENQILLSPASVDLGGVCITPREVDFNKMSKSILEDIFKQITFDDSEFEQLIGKIDKVL